ncbi:hypothetical protein AZA_90705 [Nitrospirillum viridazoti Y2]|nr:hypothetical protein AZA_90705 [Nitrospirillum amazonense Y2]
MMLEALSWLGTRYHRQADVKGAGVDCAMLLVRVYVDTGMIAPFDPRPYAVEWHLHQAAQRYVEWVERHCTRFDPAEIEPLGGDLVVVWFGKCFSHGGILVSRHDVVHAHARDRAVVQGHLDHEPFVSRQLAFYRPNRWVI